MSRQIKIETWVGFLVLITMASVVFIALQVSNYSAVQDRSSSQV